MPCAMYGLPLIKVHGVWLSWMSTRTSPDTLMRAAQSGMRLGNTAQPDKKWEA